MEGLNLNTLETIELMEIQSVLRSARVEQGSMVSKAVSTLFYNINRELFTREFELQQKNKEVEQTLEE